MQHYYCLFDKVRFRRLAVDK